MLKRRQFLATVWRYLRLSPVKFLSLWQIAFISGCPQVAKTILNKKVRDITVLPPWWDDSNGFLISWKFKYPLINILLPWQNWFSSVLETLWKGERLDASQVLTWPPGHTLEVYVLNPKCKKSKQWQVGHLWFCITLHHIVSGSFPNLVFKGGVARFSIFWP